MNMKDLGDAVIYLGAIAAALAAIGVVVRYAVLTPMKRWVREQIQPGLLETRDTAAAVHAEVSPDHGRSIKDVVDRTETKVDTLDRRVDTLAQRFDDHLINHPSRESA